MDVKDLGDGSGRYELFTHGGRKETGLEAVAWAEKMAEFGAGEILLTSMDRDGTKDGYDLGITRAISDAVDIPVIASGGVVILTTLLMVSPRVVPTPSLRPASFISALIQSVRPKST